MNFTFDTTINVPTVVAVVVFVGGIVGTWYSFRGRLDMLEYRVEAIEKALVLISGTLKTIAETDKKLAVIDERQLALEKTQATTAQVVEGLRRGQGYIQLRRSNLDGEYTEG